MNQNAFPASSLVSFADVAHQMLTFDRTTTSGQLVLELIETKWIQRLRQIRQTGNANLVYMFAEHSRFGHSLGAAYLALLLMDHLALQHRDKISPYRNAVAAAALLHDIGHLAPGSHLASFVWGYHEDNSHEAITLRIVQEENELRQMLARYDPALPDLVAQVLAEDPRLPPWTTAMISGGGWNVDRGNWTIVDSAMCSVTYGRYNVAALISSFTLSSDGRLLLQENRLDALTHFFVARDSMYRQVYQHRVLQAADALACSVIRRVRDLLDEQAGGRSAGQQAGLFCDETMAAVLATSRYAHDLPLPQIFEMTDSWWNYHLAAWCKSSDTVLRDLASRLRNRCLFKTVRLSSPDSARDAELLQQANAAAERLGFDPRYYVTRIGNPDTHRRHSEKAPLVLLDTGELVEVTQAEPLISSLLQRPSSTREWLAVPEEVKTQLGRLR